MEGARWLHRIGYSSVYKYTPGIVNRWFWQSQTVGRLDLSDEERLKRHMSEFETPRSAAEKKDAEVLTDPDTARRCLRAGREAFTQGYDASLQDGKIFTTNFGFRIEDIRPDLPVQLLYGKQDVFVPLHHGETIAKRLGNRATLRVEDETHATIFFKWREQILEDLVKAI
jgi:pimeloyl-ACP methyl ester carboxylesterase